MRGVLIAFVLFAQIACAQAGADREPVIAKPGTSPPGTGQSPKGTVLLCKLESVTWNPETEELSWVISTRDVAASADLPAKRETYTIHLDTAVMNSNGEGRRFDANEAHQVGQLMEMINVYTVESTVWWAKGFGEKMDGKPAAPPPTKEPDKPKGDPPKPGPQLRGE